MKKMPKLGAFLLSGLVSLFTLATIGCTSPARKAAEQAEHAKVQRALDVQEIQNVMSKHAYYSATGQHQRELDELWTMTTQGVSWGTDEGFWVDAKQVEDYYVRYFDTVRARELAAFSKLHPEVKDVKENYGAGTSMFQTLSTPVIEIAGDGQTAKGLWYSVGQVSQTPGGKQTPTYVWERYGVDFYKPNADWKIWHFFVHRDWSGAPGQGWVSGPGGGPGGRGGAGEISDAPVPEVRTARDKNASPYAPPSEFLKVPQPYRTFSLTFSYGPPDNR
jgi:hypothetical protein